MKPQKQKKNYRFQPCRDIFTCKVCGWVVGPEGAGTNHRNHCPNCLSSLHVDETLGDRAADCGGVMVCNYLAGEGVTHRCKRCGTFGSNRIAADDDPVKLMSLAARPLGMPPFPLDLMERMARQLEFTEE